jgi:hypothetical protein
MFFVYVYFSFAGPQKLEIMLMVHQRSTSIDLTNFDQIFFVYCLCFICRPAETENNVYDLPTGNNGDDPPPIEY